MSIKIFSNHRFKACASIFMMFSLLLMPVKALFALTPLQSLDVDGVHLYDIGGGYNSGHGLVGVTFDEGSETLTLTNASLNNISAVGDLKIVLVGENLINTETDVTSILAMGGNLTISGDSASLTISAYPPAGMAISIGAAQRFTVGGVEGEQITVSILQGMLNNCEDTYVVDGNTLNLPDMGGPGGPPPGIPLQISVGGNLVIDETADPQITSASGTGWTITYSEYGGYQIDIDASLSPNFEYISGTGDGTISINAINGDVNITSPEGGQFSVFFDGNVYVLFGMGAEIGDVYMDGGIFTGGDVIGGDGDVYIGTLLDPAEAGVYASRLAISYSRFVINTLGTGVGFYNIIDPAPEDGMFISASQGGELIVESSTIATSNVISALVLGGGSIDLTYSSGGGLGFFISQAGYWNWTEFTGTEVENVDPVIVDCVEGLDVENKYSLTMAENNYLLESISNPLHQLGFNYEDSEDSKVVNGMVNVIAANGYKFVSGGFYDFSIEEGTEVTIELLPDYGYQYVSGGINGVTTFPESGKASYTFIMPDHHVHISAIFERTSDIVSVDSDSISAANLTMPTGAINGNAELLVEDAADVDTSGFLPIAGDFSVDTFLDLSLNELIFKGTSEDVWRTNITELESDTTVTLTLSDELKGHAEYKVLRDHNGTVEELTAIYDPSTGTLTFNTDAYSTYAIAYNDPANPNTNDTLLSSLVLGLTSSISLFALGIYLNKNRKLQLNRK